MEEDAAPMMILELMPYGDLHFFLQANKLVTEHHYQLFNHHKSGVHVYESSNEKMSAPSHKGFFAVHV